MSFDMIFPTLVEVSLIYQSISLQTSAPSKFNAILEVIRQEVSGSIHNSSIFFFKKLS